MLKVCGCSTVHKLVKAFTNGLVFPSTKPGYFLSASEACASRNHFF